MGWSELGKNELKDAQNQGKDPSRNTTRKGCCTVGPNICTANLTNSYKVLTLATHIYLIYQVKSLEILENKWWVTVICVNFGLGMISFILMIFI